MRMRWRNGTAGRIAALAALIGLSAGLGGCAGAIAGNWRLVDAKPNRQTFSIDHASFKADGTYVATTTIEGQTAEEKGTYEFSGTKLKLRPSAGGQRTYSAMLKLDKLEITSGKRMVVLQKGS